MHKAQLDDPKTEYPPRQQSNLAKGESGPNSAWRQIKIAAVEAIFKDMDGLVDSIQLVDAGGGMGEACWGGDTLRGCDVLTIVHSTVKMGYNVPEWGL